MGISQINTNQLSIMEGLNRDDGVRVEKDNHVRAKDCLIGIGLTLVEQGRCQRLAKKRKDRLEDTNHLAELQKIMLEKRATQRLLAITERSKACNDSETPLVLPALKALQEKYLAFPCFNIPECPDSERPDASEIEAHEAAFFNRHAELERAKRKERLRIWLEKLGKKVTDQAKIRKVTTTTSECPDSERPDASGIEAHEAAFFNKHAELERAERKERLRIWLEKLEKKVTDQAKIRKVTTTTAIKEEAIKEEATATATTEEDTTTAIKEDDTATATTEKVTTTGTTEDVITTTEDVITTTEDVTAPPSFRKKGKGRPRGVHLGCWSSSSNNTGSHHLSNRNSTQVTPFTLDLGTSLIIRNLKYRTRAEAVVALRRHFSGIGELANISIPLDLDSRTRKPLGFAFVEYVKPEDAQLAMKRMNGTTIDGSVISVSVAKDRRRHFQQSGHGGGR